LCFSGYWAGPYFPLLSYALRDVVRIYVTTEQEEGAAADPKRTVASHARFIQLSTVWSGLRPY
jgi:hypothetical protein